MTPCGPLATDPINSYALVTYIPDHLGEFLTRLRTELASDCIALSHVTILPPRPLEVSADVAAQAIERRLQTTTPAFLLGVAEVQVFDITDVVYLEIGRGREELLWLHMDMNEDELSFIEQYPFHPHVTLAQNIGPDAVHEAFELAKARWEEYKYERSFMLDRVTFVQNTNENRWIDLVTFDLKEPAGMLVP